MVNGEETPVEPNTRNAMFSAVPLRPTSIGPSARPSQSKESQVKLSHSAGSAFLVYAVGITADTRVTSE